MKIPQGSTREEEQNEESLAEATMKAWQQTYDNREERIDYEGSSSLPSTEGLAHISYGEDKLGTASIVLQYEVARDADISAWARKVLLENAIFKREVTAKEFKQQSGDNKDTWFERGLQKKKEAFQEEVRNFNHPTPLDDLVRYRDIPDNIPEAFRADARQQLKERGSLPLLGPIGKTERSPQEIKSAVAKAKLTVDGEEKELQTMEVTSGSVGGCTFTLTPKVGGCKITSPVQYPDPYGDLFTLPIPVNDPFMYIPVHERGFKPSTFYIGDFAAFLDYLFLTKKAHIKYNDTPYAAFGATHSWEIGTYSSRTETIYLNLKATFDILKKYKNDLPSFRLQLPEGKDNRFGLAEILIEKNFAQPAEKQVKTRVRIGRKRVRGLAVSLKTFNSYSPYAHKTC